MSFASRGFINIQSYPLISAKFIKNAGITNSTQVRALGYLGESIYDFSLSTKLTSVYPFIGGSAVTHQYNFLNTAQFPLTFVGSPTHSSNGTAFNGTTQYATVFQLGTASGLNMANLSGGYRTKSMGTGTYIPWGFYMPSGTQTVTYSTPGTFSFNPLTDAGGATGFTINAWGGGGAGGGVNGTISQYSAGGGAGGNSNTGNFVITNTSTSITITVGAGGLGVTGGTGGNGGQSIVSHPDFTSGDLVASGNRGGGPNLAAGPGSGGTVTPDSPIYGINVGGAGGAGGSSTARGAGGGGSSATPGFNGGAGSTPNNASGGVGGTRPPGGTGGVGGSNPNGLGGAGFSPGGGGGGAGGRASGLTNPGAAGAGGKVTVAWTVPTFKRFGTSVFNSTSQQLFDGSVTTDVTSRWSQNVGTPGVATDGNRIFTRRANTGVAATDGAFYLNGTSLNNQSIAVLANTNLVGTPLLYLAAANTWGGLSGNAAGNLYSGTLNFAFVGSGLTNADIVNMDTIMTTYTNILGR